MVMEQHLTTVSRRQREQAVSPESELSAKFGGELNRAIAKQIERLIEEGRKLDDWREYPNCC
jgi:hypothetical protein